MKTEEYQNQSKDILNSILMRGCFVKTEEYQNQSKDILNSILIEDILSDSDSEEPIEES